MTDKSGQRSGQTTNESLSAGNLSIPKHRFDCVNLCLKETKQALHEKTEESRADKLQIASLETMLLESKVETAIARHHGKNLKAIKALIDFSNLKLEQNGCVPALEEEILRIKKSQDYLFENQTDTTYVLVPVKNGSSLDKSIMNYIIETEKEK